MRKVKPIIPVEYGENDLFEPKNGQRQDLCHAQYLFRNRELGTFPRSYTELRKLIAILKKYPTMCITIIGHTDNTGTQEYNQEL